MEAVCQINPSEDPEKIKALFSNILDGFELKLDGYSAKATASEIESLSKIHDSIQKHHSKRVYWRFLNNNLEENSTWFYLNKQAAFVDTITLCEHDNESPLGPVKVTIHSKNIERIIEWLAN